MPSSSKFLVPAHFSVSHFFFFWLSISGGSHSALIHKLSLSYLSQVSPRPRISLAWLLLLFLCCPQPQSRGGLEGLQDRARLREAMFRHPAPSRQQPRPQALWPMQCTPGSSVISPSVSREAAIRACVPGQLSSLLNAPFCTCFSFSFFRLDKLLLYHCSIFMFTDTFRYFPLFKSGFGYL